MFGFRAYPTPILKPLGPFIAGAVIVFWATNSLQNSMLKSEEFKKDPRNPYGEWGTAMRKDGVYRITRENRRREVEIG
jgi:F-type H+-transporting ATPase subunit j